MKKRISFFIGICFVVLIEVFVFNWSFWKGMSYQSIRELDVHDWDAVPIVYNQEYLVTEGFCLEISDICADVNNIFLHIDTDKPLEENILHIRLSLIDQGNSYYYELPDKVISSSLTSLNYISLYSYGTLSSIRIDFPNEIGTKIVIRDIVLNAQPEFHISLYRLGFMMVLYIAIVGLFVCGESIYFDEKSLKQKVATALLCLLTCIGLIVLVHKSFDEPSIRTLSSYQELAQAMANGHFYLEQNPAQGLIELENPYDFGQRVMAGLNEKWDYAYFQGHYYVYFGVVPVLLFFLPYYLLTGQQLSPTIVYQIFLVFFIIGCFRVIDELVRKYNSKISLKMYYLLQLVFSLGAGGIIFAKRMGIYTLCIMAGGCFTVWGISCWLSAVRKTEVCLTDILIGSLCMALVAGCRPQMLMGSFFAFPILFPTFLSMGKALHKNRKGITSFFIMITVFVIPYIIVAIGLMYYNNSRFGSPFDFGAVYNLTTNDMRYRGWHWARCMGGIWYYLLEPPIWQPEFPYLVAHRIQTTYQGITIQEKGVGGIFLTNVILLCTALLFNKNVRKNMKQNKSFIFAIIAVINVIIIVLVDTQMAGMLTRYKGDFSIFMYIVAYLCILSWLKVDQCEGKNKCIYVLGLLTIVFLGTMVLAQYETGDYNEKIPVWYFHLQEILQMG